MQNPNDKTAKYYDQVSSYLKTAEVIEQELNLVHSLIPKDIKAAKILDIGCGTGRHLIPLVKAGFDVIGIDSSEGILTHLKKNFPSAQIINGDIFTTTLESGKYDLIVMFWNTWNEICISNKQAHTLLSLCKTALNAKGKLLINIDDITKIDPSFLDFHYRTEELDYDWRVEEYLATNRTTVSAETITASDGIRHVARITQRWWSLEEMKDLALKADLKLTIKHIKANGEFYFVAEKSVEREGYGK